ncbi:bacteriocin [Vibrio owensii]|uniref:bacteriocin n=1 Tax=Vibrio owensii TaxID=696485 RepID=UPI001F1D0CCE|nr:bacteriocin [Vibrio owensii]
MNSDSLKQVETNDAIYLVDKKSLNTVLGRYLIDIDGNLSINGFQPLPGKALAIAFGNTSLVVSEYGITAMGIVAVTSKKIRYLIYDT